MTDNQHSKNGCGNPKCQLTDLHHAYIIYVPGCTGRNSTINIINKGEENYATNIQI